MKRKRSIRTIHVTIRSLNTSFPNTIKSVNHSNPKHSIGHYKSHRKKEKSRKTSIIDNSLPYSKNKTGARVTIGIHSNVREDDISIGCLCRSVFR